MRRFDLLVLVLACTAALVALAAAILLSRLATHPTGNTLAVNS